MSLMMNSPSLTKDLNKPIKKHNEPINRLNEPINEHNTKYWH